MWISGREAEIAKKAINDMQALEIECDGLRGAKITLTDEVASLKLQAKIEEEDIKHMVKMTEEKDKLTLDKAIFEAEKKATEGIANVKDAYRDKVEKSLESEVEKMESMYSQILERLPNVNYELTKDL